MIRINTAAVLLFLLADCAAYAAADCPAFARYAVQGGAQALRGKPRAIIPLKRGSILARVAIGDNLSVPGIALWDDEITAGAVVGVLYGWDWVAEHHDSTPPSAEAAFAMFAAACEMIAADLAP